MRAPLTPTTSIQSRYAVYRLLAKTRRAYLLDRQFSGIGLAGLDRRQGRDAEHDQPNAAELQPGVYEVPVEIDKQVAALKLAAMGVPIPADVADDDDRALGPRRRGL